MTAQDVFAVRDRTGRVRALLHSVPLDFAVSSFTAAASTPHDANAPLWGGCVMTGHFPQNYFTLTTQRKSTFYSGILGLCPKACRGNPFPKKLVFFTLKKNRKKGNILKIDFPVPHPLPTKINFARPILELCTNPTKGLLVP